MSEMSEIGWRSTRRRRMNGQAEPIVRGVRGRKVTGVGSSVRRGISRQEQDRRLEFARRLTTLRVKKGWSQSELARRAAIHVPDKTFGRDNISKYEKGTSTPLPLFLMALSKALNVNPGELMPERAGTLDAPMEVTETLEFKQVGRGRAWIRLNQEVPEDVAYAILGLLQNRKDK